MRSSFLRRIAPAALAALAIAGPFTAVGQNLVPSPKAAAEAGVRDRARMFTPGAVSRADAVLEEVRDRTGWRAVIETVETVGGAPVEEAARRNAQALQVRGLYVLIPKKERKVWVVPSRSSEAVFTADRVREVRDAITTAFKAGEFDRGLADAVAVVRAAAGDGNGRVASTTAARPTLPGPVEKQTEARPLVPESERAKANPGANAPPPAFPAPRPGPSTLPGPAPRPVPRGPDAEPGSGGGLGTLLMLGGAALLALWVFSKLRGARPGPNAPIEPVPLPNTGPTQFAVPQAPQGVPGPGYGPGPPPPPAGGGFMSGMLGGLGGAVVGNVLYDQFGRPHPSNAPHDRDVPPPAPETSWPAASPEPASAAESYDPNAGAGGDWGDDAAPAPDDAGGDWGGGDVGDDQGGSW